MASQQTSENKTSFFKNDRALVCGMLVFYSICILGLLGATAWWLGDRNYKISLNATATAGVGATEQAQVTATAISRVTQQAQYDWIEPFDSSILGWRSGSENNEYWRGNIRIVDGIYLWDVLETRETFISRADFPINSRIKDFDVYVDTKLLEENPGNICSGLIFRETSDLEEDGGYYYYALCNDSWAKVSYHSENDGWINRLRLPYFQYSSGWNRLEITARGKHFVFRINGTKIFEMDDEHPGVGKLGLAVELNEKVPAVVQFDNFGYQPR